MCSGVFATFVGIGKEKNGHDVVMLHLDGFNGSVPFVPNRSFLERWTLAPQPINLKPVGVCALLKPAASRVVPAVSSLYHKPLDLMASVDSGVQPMSLVQFNGQRVLLLGAEPISGLYIGRDASTLEYVSIPPKSEVTVLALRDPLPMQKAVAGNAREVTYKKTPLEPGDSIKASFPYLCGVRNPSVRLMDADPDRCFRYFGIRPGDRACHPTDATAIGCTEGDGVLQLWFHVDGSPGAGVFEDGQDIRLSGEVVTVHPSKSLRPLIPPMPRPSANSPGTQWKIPKLTEAMCRHMKFTTPYVARSGMIVLLDISDAALTPLGFRHGQVMSDSGTLNALVGVGKDVDGALEVWALVEDFSTIGVNKAGDVVKLFDHLHPVPAANSARTIVYQPVDKPKHMDLSFTFSYQLGRESTKAVLLDADPTRCRALFGIVPGQRVNRGSTVVGMGVDDKQKIDMYFHADGHNGCGTYTPNTRLSVEDVFVQVDPMIVSTINYAPVDERSDDKLVLNFWFMRGTEACTPCHFDADADRCKRYFGIVPGQRIDGRATAVGMMMLEGKVNMFFLADGHNGAGTFSDHTVLSFDPDEPLDVLDPIFLDESKIYSTKKVPVNPNDPLELTFACKFGVDQTCITWIDADAQRCKRYLGIVPGQRATNATFYGIRVDPQDPLILEELWHADGRKGAGVFSIGDTLLLEDEILKVKPAQPIGTRRFITYPRGPYRTVKVPKLSRDPAGYNFSFPFFHKGIIVRADIENVERLVGMKHGQPVLLENDILTCVVGVAVDPRDVSKDVELFVARNGGDAMMLRPNSVVRVSDTAPRHPLAPVDYRQIVYKEKEVEVGNPLQCTFSYKVGTQDAAFRLVDADPARCRHYFGIVPGQRVDGNSTAIGMMHTGGRTINMMFHVDSSPGAGKYGDGTQLFIEVGEVIKVSEISAEDSVVNQHGGGAPLGQRSRSSLEMEEESESCLFEPSKSDLCGDDLVSDHCEQFPPLFLSNQAALDHVKNSSYEQSRSHIIQLTAKLERLGHDDAQMTLFNMLTHLQHQVPIVSWMNPHKLVQGKPVIERMTEDVMMRTLFETQDGNGSKNTVARQGWEDSLFPGAYGPTAQPVERPKYGLLNIFNDPRGPLVEGNQYGDCFLVFSPELRQFSTMTAFDSSGVSRRDCGVCTLFDGQGKVFSQFKEEGKEVETFARVASGRCPFASSDGTFYKELQVHANVFFQQHITHVVIHNRYLTRMADLHLLFNFAKKNNAMLVTVRTLTKVCNMRAWGIERLLAEATSRGLDEPFSAVVTSSLVLSGPHGQAARKVFRAILDDSCRRDMIDIETKLAESGNTTWRSSKKQSARQSDPAGRGASTARSGSTGGEDPAAALARLLAEAEGAGHKRPKECSPQ